MTTAKPNTIVPCPTCGKPAQVVDLRMNPDYADDLEGEQNPVLQINCPYCYHTDENVTLDTSEAKPFMATEEDLTILISAIEEKLDSRAWDDDDMKYLIDLKGNMQRLVDE